MHKLQTPTSHPNILEIDGTIRTCKNAIARPMVVKFQVKTVEIGEVWGTFVFIVAVADHAERAAGGGAVISRKSESGYWNEDEGD